ncbi:MAG: DUF1501 domain-containing protein [Polyangiaceae bacterium]
MSLSRRNLLLGSFAAALGLGTRPAEGQAPDAPAPVARSLIVLWMNGGASHIDTFDPKTGETAGPFESIATNNPALRISEHLPQLATLADRYTVVRSLTSKEGNHQRARYLGHTGYAPSPTLAHPSLGAWVSHERGGEGDLPRFVSVGGPSAGPGFLGAAHGPLLHRRVGERPDHSEPGFGIDEARAARRRESLALLERRFAAATRHPDVTARGEVYARAERLMKSPDLAAFDLDDEPEAVRRAYGDSDFGRGCLLARRLVEAEVPVVEVTLDGWDTHQDNFTRSRKLMADLDPAMASLLRDLAERELLDTTLVLWIGDFGRSPRINGREGRDHHPKAQSAVLAGGGIRGGLVHGATDARGETVVQDPLSVPDLFATVAWQLGLDPSKTVDTPAGRPIAITDGGSARAVLRAG